MAEWWHNLTPVNQSFYIAAAFFSAFFLWQLAAALLGLAGGDHNLDGHDGLDTHVDVGGAHHTPDDAAATVVAFKLLSIRSVLAFLTLFAWAAALYLNTGLTVGTAMGYGAVWGAAAMLVVSVLMYLLRRMTEEGNPRIQTCLNAAGVVYLDIPAAGQGEVRVLVSGVSTHLKARCAGGLELKAGRQVRVVRIIGPTLIEVQPVEASPPA